MLGAHSFAFGADPWRLNHGKGSDFMEEKLTDDKWFETYKKTARAFEQGYADHIGYGGTADADAEYEIAFDNRIIAYVTSLKAEIERLTEEANQDTVTHIDICTENLSLRKQNAELQKQVDELKERYLEESKERCKFEQLYEKKCHDHNIGAGVQRSHWEKKVQQAVKDTVKEVYDYAKDFFKWDEEGFVSSLKYALENRYGVEVE